MQDKKYQVFISSTFIDLKDERDHAMKAVLEMGHIPIGMELFHASDETQWQLIQKRIDESDYYVLILAHRYGSADDDGIGYTEKEYDYAVAKGVPVLSFIIDESIDWQPKFIDKGKDLKKLSAFKAKASHKKMVQFWTNKDNLNSKIKSALQNQIIINPRNGWVRADETDYKNVAVEFARLSEENKKYSDLIKELQHNANDNNEDLVNHLQNATISFDLNGSNIQNAQSLDLNVKIDLLQIIKICEDELHSSQFRMEKLLGPLERFIKNDKQISFIPQNHNSQNNIILVSRPILIKKGKEVMSDIKDHLLAYGIIDRVDVVQYSLTLKGKELFKYLLKQKINN